MSDTLYERDILLWSEQQAATLQRLADGERVNDAVDWPNVIEEVLSVGSSEFNSVQSLLEEAIVHLLKLRLSPGDMAANHWRGEVAAFLSQARRRYSPSMGQRVDMTDLFGQAVRQLRSAGVLARGHVLLSTPCPYTLSDLIADRTVSELEQLLPAFDNNGPAA